MKYFSYRPIDLVPFAGRLTFEVRNPGVVSTARDDYQRRFKDFAYEFYQDMLISMIGPIILTGLIALDNL